MKIIKTTLLIVGTALLTAISCKKKRLVHLMILLMVISGTFLFACKKGNDPDKKEEDKITVRASDFGEYHPCGIAVSNAGSRAVAVSTYEGDNQDGKIFIWESLAAFRADAPANYAYNVKQPEALAFDGNTLYISGTYESRIYYTADIKKAPTDFFDISGTGNSNPRGLTTQDGNLFVMCENLHPVAKNSVVLKVTNPAGSNRTFAEVQGSAQPHANGNALSVHLVGGQMYTTDIWRSTVSRYVYNSIDNTASLSKRLENAGMVMDVTGSPASSIYFTNIANGNCHLVAWSHNALGIVTSYISLGPPDGVYAAWGLVLLEGGDDDTLIVADAPRNRVRILDVSTVNWQQ